MAKKKTHAELVLDFYQDHAFTCTKVEDGVQPYGLSVKQLIAAIGKLRDEGYLIETQRVYYRKPDGTEGKYVRYWFHGHE